jgi:hypothetical protein
MVPPEHVAAATEASEAADEFGAALDGLLGHLLTHHQDDERLMVLVRRLTSAAFRFKGTIRDLPGG